jgi:eukaryotic-like serine/threonine-protein kinase
VPISAMESAGDKPTKPRAALGGRFWLEEKLGEDASGELHRGIDLRSGTATMVRIVRGEGAARRDRLLRETRRAAQVKHPGLAVVLGVGETDEGDIFVAAETIVGDRLSDRLRVGERFDDWEAAEIATQIAHAVAAAHEADVVHRELRPSLIVLTYEGDTTIVKVEGLGVPRAPSASGDDPELAYSAPEQRRREPVGRRADVYSIGGMLYAMVTGVAPTADAPPIEGVLGAVVRRCLAEDPKDRFQDTITLSAAMKVTVESLPPRVPSRMPMLASTPPVEEEVPSSAPSPHLAPAVASVPVPVEAPPTSSQRPPSVRPTSSSDPPSALRPPAAPPPRPLNRPLTARPRWKELVLDLTDGPLPRVVLVIVVMFIVARILTSTWAAVVASLAAGLGFYATWSKTRGQPPDR